MSKVKAALAVLVAALALGAAISSSASGATAGWMVNKTLLTSTKALASTAKVDEKFKLTAAGVGIQCGANVIDFDGELQVFVTTPPWLALGRLILLECSPVSPVCSLGSPTIGTVPLGGEVTLQGTSETRVIFAPKTKTTIATIRYEDETCALAGIQSVSGKASLLEPTGQVENTLQLIKAAITEASGELKVGTSAASLEGSALLQLASGESWSFL